MEALAPFRNRERYAGFIQAQHLFQRDIENLFHDSAVRSAIPDIDVRGRSAATLADLHDLNVVMQEEPPATNIVTMPAALGWIYVSEGSTLGAAFLLKEVKEKLGLSAEFGARHLGAYPQGRAQAWHDFTNALDRFSHDEAAQNAVVQGALAAFDRFADLLKRFLPKA